MASLAENITQVIADFDDIKAAITEKGVSVPDGIRTSQYGDLIRQISGGGGEVLNWDVSYAENHLWKASTTSGTYVPSYWTTGDDKGRITVPLIHNWGAVLMRDFDVRMGDDIIITGAVWSDSASLSSSAYVGFFSEDEFATITKDDIRWIHLATVVTAAKTESTFENITGKNGKLCFMCVHGNELSSYTAFFHPKSVKVVRKIKTTDA